MKKAIENWKNQIVENRILLGIVFITVFIVILPTLNSQNLIGDDYGFHLSRIQGIEQGLKAHQFPVKIFYNMANSYTYGAGLFYCNFFLYFPAFLRLMNLSIGIIEKIFITLAVFGIIVTTYIATKHITKNKKASLLAGILVVTSHYFRVDVYYRFAIGEYLAMIFMPLIIAGMWDFVYNDFKKPVYIVVGFIGVIFSHTISVILSIIYCIVFILLNIKTVWKHKPNIFKLFGCAILVALLTIAYWLPMFEQLLAQTLRYQVVSFSHTYDRCVAMSDLFSNNLFTLGYMQAVLVLAGILILIKNWKSITKEAKQFFAIGLGALLLISLKIFWEHFLVFDIIQFPWRLLGPVAILISMSVSIFLVEDNQNSNQWIVGTIFLALLFCLTENAGLVRFGNLPEDLYQLPITLGGGKEYLPVNSLIDEGVEIDYSKLDFPQEAINEKNEKILGTKKYLTFEFENKPEDEKYLIPFFYYKGYSAKHIDNAGKETKLQASLGNNGLVQVENAKQPGKIIVWYQTTNLQKVSYVLNFVLAVSTLGILIRHRMIKKDCEER